MPAIFTQLGIWNEALFEIGAQQLKTLTDLNNPAAQYLPVVWPFAIGEALEEHPWSFAVQTVPMVPLNPPAWVSGNNYNVGNFVISAGAIYVCAIANTASVFATDLAAGDWIVQAGVSPLLQPLPVMNDGCSNVYAVPSDFVNPYMFSVRAFYRKEVIKPPYLAAKTICLITNVPNIASMKYVYANTDVADWSSKFCEAMVMKLASKICFKVSEAAQYAAAFKTAYEAKLLSAIAADSNTTTPDEAIADAWFLARLTGSTAAVGLGVDGNNAGFYMPGIDY